MNQLKRLLPQQTTLALFEINRKHDLFGISSSRFIAPIVPIHGAENKTNAIYARAAGAEKKLNKLELKI